MKEIFGRDGVLSALHERFDYREEQERMARFIEEVLCGQEIGLVEAGTGVGKTIAYLAPAILYCKEHGKKLAVSTETKTLQKQLIEKEIPLVKEAFARLGKDDFTHALCLGGANYPCRMRFEAMLAMGRFTRDDLGVIDDLRERFQSEQVFTRMDVRLRPGLWAMICRESDACSPHSCPFGQGCAFQQARKEWARADILILNHYLFFANIASGRTYLPGIGVVIFDEAHALEDIASDQLGFGVSHSDITDVLSRFYRRGTKRHILSSVSSAAVRKKAISRINGIALELGGFFEGLRPRLTGQRLSARLREPLAEGKDLVSACRDLYRLVEEMEEEIDDSFVRVEYDIARSRLFTAIENLASAVSNSSDDYVYWLERREDEILGDIEIKGQPVDVAPILEREVSSYYESCIFVSATLTVNRDFSFIANRLGIPSYRHLLLQSPFDYKEQVVLYLQRGGDEPGGANFAAGSAKIAAEVIRHLDGNCLMLFTSYKMLDEVKYELSGNIGHPIFAQGEYPAPEALELYLNTPGSVLMGTHSFWQGVDLPGDLVRGVILMRLPFSVPDRPMIEVKIERLEARGQNPFYAYQVPNAVIKFRQGFGRLIRGRGDRGIVAVLDSRILSKGYGKVFLQSIPPCRIVYSIEEMKSAFTTNAQTPLGG
ncbi:MAG: ATP-dependent DNA helicase [Spirochaetes bacterium]|nr:MAG: ATP-dependent DNA helicase [Spirochaetota bacterium]